MADATPALEQMESELRDLLGRMKLHDPRRQSVNLLLFRIPSKYGVNASEAQIARLNSSTGAIKVLLVTGSFNTVITEAQAAVNAL